MFDFIVVGARCAGSSTATLLAKKGFRVLLLDHARFPSDTLSSHFLWPRGLSYLNRWGHLAAVLDRTPSGTEIEFKKEGVRFVAETPKEMVESRFRKVHGEAQGVVNQHASVRRIVLDQLLLDGAIGAGVEFRDGVTVDRLIFERGRVTGIEGRTPSGIRFQEHAKYVVGADGRNSTVGKLVDAEVFNVRTPSTFGYWTYFSGLCENKTRMEKKGRLAVVSVPTNFNATMVLAFGPNDLLPLFRKNFVKNYRRMIDFVSPDLGEQLAEVGRQEERLYGVIDQKTFHRKSSGPGWLLVGDAACIKDQCTAIGMTHAFRDAELAASALSTALTQGDPGDLRLQDYSARRESDLVDYYEFVSLQAEMPEPTPQDIMVAERLAEEPALANAFAAMYGDSLPVGIFQKEVRPQLLLGLQSKSSTRFRPRVDERSIFLAG